MISMVAFSACAFGLALVQAHQQRYDPDTHLSFLEKSFNTVVKERNEIANRRESLQDGVQHLGTILGQSRKLQTQLSSWFIQDGKSSPGKALRIVQVAGIFDAYLSSTILELDGDTDQSELAASMGKRLKRVWAKSNG